MQNTILITGSTDGIGQATAKKLLAMGHRVLLHGRNLEKLKRVEASLSPLSASGSLESYTADLSQMDQVEGLAKAVREKHDALDVLINNAGVFKTPVAFTKEGLDVRFAVNTFAPYLLTKLLLPLLGPSGRVINLSSAAQSPVHLKALDGRLSLSAMEAYAQSKLAITMWSRHLALALGKKGPVIVAVNPGSLLGSKMVKEGFGVAGGDLGIGADILTRAALNDEFADAPGKYFDNDAGRFGPPHPHALDPQKTAEITAAIEAVLAQPGR